MPFHVSTAKNAKSKLIPFINTSKALLYSLKLMTRWSAAMFGVDGRLLRRGYLLQLAIPCTISVIMWVSEYFTPRPDRSVFAQWWLPSEPEWAGLQGYTKELILNIIVYILFTQMYIWLWGNLVGKLRQNSYKFLMAIIVPYYILPIVIPTLSYYAFARLVGPYLF